MAGSVVSTRSIFCAASSEPSATTTLPARCEDPLPTPPPCWIDGQGHPAERPAALLELGPDERRHETRIVERVLDAGVPRLRAEVVAVVEDDRAVALEREHRPHMVGHRGGRAADVLIGLVLTE